MIAAIIRLNPDALDFSIMFRICFQPCASDSGAICTGDDYVRNGIGKIKRYKRKPVL